MQKKSIKKNYFYNLFYQILLLITPLITTPYVSRILGADGIGTVSFIESVASYFVLFAVMGITTYGQREISYVQDSKEKRSEVFWNTKILEFWTSGVILIAYLIFTTLQENRVFYYMYAFQIVAIFYDVTWFFQGLEDFGKIVLRNAFFKIMNIIYIFIVVRNKESLIWYVFGLSFFTFIGNISLWFYLPRYIDRPKLNELHPFKNIKTVLQLFVPTIAIQVYTVLDKTMIGVITKDTFENGYYEQALKISKMVLMVVTALGTVMIPRIGYHFKRGNEEEVKRLMYRGYRFVWMLGVPLCVGLIMVSSNFVPWFFGDGYDRVADILAISSFLILAIGINNVTGMQYLIPTGRQNMFTLTVIIGAIVNFCLNMVLIRSWGAEGAAVASVAAETTIAIVQIIFVRKELSPLRIVQESLHYVIAGMCMGAVLYYMRDYFDSSIINTIILVIIGASAYGAVLLIERDEFLLSNIKMMTNKI